VDSIIGGGYVLARLLLGILVQGTVSVSACWYVKHTRTPRGSVRGKYAQFELPGNFTKLTYNDSISD